jgi:hypothetical protein
MSSTENVKNSLSWGTLKRHISIGCFVVYIDSWSPMLNIPSKSRGLEDENKKLLMEWKWLETSGFFCFVFLSEVIFVNRK